MGFCGCLNQVRSNILQCFLSCCTSIPQRYFIVALCSVGTFLAFFERRTFYQALYDVVDQKVLEDRSFYSECPVVVQARPHHRMESLDYQPWKVSQVMAIRQAYYLGYLVSLVPSGIVADIYGPKKIVTAGVMLSTCFTVMFPITVSMGAVTTTVARLFQGLAQGLVYPGVACLIARWTPPSERTSAIAFVWAPEFFGWSLSYLAHSLYHRYSFDWNSQFYICAAAGLFWLAVWAVFAFSRPINCPYISTRELQKLISTDEYDRLVSQAPKFIPWREILYSRPFQVLLLMNWAGSWTRHCTMHYFRLYMSNIVGLPWNLSYELAEFALFATGISILLFGIAGDWLINNGYMSRTQNRKWFATISNVLVVLCLSLILCSGCSAFAVASLYLCLCYARGPFHISIRSNVIDLNPHYTGTLIGILFMTGATGTLFALNGFQALCRNTSDIMGWRMLFLVLAGLHFVTNLPYLIYGTAEKQEWGLIKFLQFDEEIKRMTSSMLSQQEDLSLLSQKRK